ncbi:DUF317 domain-containing protein [Streptomyces sp. NPDC050095]|uniref:DUF317 domain-containing protein n=1 Tax=unclassified Streptomyces TaxID=2593676 RepID=UPI0034134600
MRLEHLPDSLFHEPPLTPVSIAFDPLVAAGWHKERTENFHRAESPDGLAGLQLQRWPRDEAPEPEPADLIWQFTAGNGAAAWSAEFSRDTPLRILKALTVAVTDPAAVRREPALIPAAHRPHVTVHPITATSTGPAALAPAPDVRRPASR